MFAVKHDVVIQKGGILEKIFKNKRVITVNSVHCQAIKKLSLSAKDGNSLRNYKGFLLGVQWHPECFTLKKLKKHKKIFSYFGLQVRKYYEKHKVL